MQCCAGKKKTKERCMRKMMGKILRECTYNTWSKEREGTELLKETNGEKVT